MQTCTAEAMSTHFHSYEPGSNVSDDEGSRGISCPKLRPGDDKDKWAKRIRDWVSFTKQRSLSGERRSKADMSTLGYLVYGNLSSEFKSTIDLHKENRMLDFADSVNQEQVVETIIQLIGDDSMFDKTHRTMCAFRKAYTCVRRNDELPCDFVDRFRAMADTYFRCAQLSSRDRGNQLLAMIFLENCKLVESTTNAIKAQLAQICKNRSEKLRKPSEVTAAVTYENLQQIYDALENINELSEPVNEVVPTDQTEEEIQIAKEKSEKERKNRLEEIPKIKEFLKVVRDALPESCIPTDSIRFQSNGGFYCDEVYEIVKTFSRPEELPPKRTMMGKRTHPSNHGSTSNNRKKQRLDENKRKYPCNACGQFGHWMKDPKCPKYKSRNDDAVKNGNDRQRGNSNESGRYTGPKRRNNSKPFFGQGDH